MTTIKEVLEVSVKGIYQAGLNYLDLTTKEQSDTRANRAYESGTFDSLSGNDDPQQGAIAAGGFGYRAEGQKGKRDFSAMTHDQIIGTVWDAYQSNGIAERAIEFRMAAILGRDTQPETPDENLQEILDQFWNRNLSNNHNLKRFVIAHSLFGELILPVFVRKADGRVLLGYIDPGDVEEKGIIFHPENNLERWAVVLKQRQNEKKRKCYRIIREDEGTIYQDVVIPPQYPGKLITWQQATLEDWEIAFLKEKGLTEYSGSCFYFDKNNLANQPRGFSDLLQSVDWMDANDEVLFSLAEREQFANYFSWLVKLTGASPEVVKQRASELRTSPPMGKGQANVHNDSEEWEFVTSDLKQSATIATAQATKKQALEGLNQPITWHNEMDTSNRATAERADNPTNRHLQHEQADMVEWILFICRFVADQAEIVGFYKPEDENEITIQVPEIVKGDVVEISNAFSQTVNALLVTWLDLKVIDREITSQVVSKLIAEYGVQYNPAEILDRIDEQVEQAAMDTQTGINQFLSDTIEKNGSAEEIENE
jgi:hypothetical protein